MNHHASHYNPTSSNRNFSLVNHLGVLNDTIATVAKLVDVNDGRSERRGHVSLSPPRRKYASIA